MNPQLILAHGDNYSKWIYLYENRYAQSLDFVVSNTSGLRWGANEIAAASYPYSDGDVVQNFKGLPREIEIELKPTGNTEDFSIIYDKFSELLGERCQLIWTNRKTADGVKTVRIDGAIMTACELPTNEQDTRLVMTFHCPEPFWYDESSSGGSYSGQVAHTIKGTAPPKNLIIDVDDGKIPASDYLYVGGWKFKAANTALTGTLSFEPFSVKVDNVPHLETVASDMSAKALGKRVLIEYYEGGAGVRLPFYISYNAQYY